MSPSNWLALIVFSNRIEHAPLINFTPVWKKLRLASPWLILCSMKYSSYGTFFDIDAFRFDGLTAFVAISSLRVNTFGAYATKTSVAITILCKSSTKFEHSISSADFFCFYFTVLRLQFFSLEDLIWNYFTIFHNGKSLTRIVDRSDRFEAGTKLIVGSSTRKITASDLWRWYTFVGKKGIKIRNNFNRIQWNKEFNAQTMLINECSLTQARILMNCLCCRLTCYRYARCKVYAHTNTERRSYA